MHTVVTAHRPVLTEASPGPVPLSPGDRSSWSQSHCFQTLGVLGSKPRGPSTALHLEPEAAFWFQRFIFTTRSWPNC